jgi:hypothetical protein
LCGQVARKREEKPHGSVTDVVVEEIRKELELAIFSLNISSIAKSKFRNVNTVAG